MKKLLTLSVLAFAAVNCFSQGQVAVGNNVAPYRFPIYFPEPSNPYVQISGNSDIARPVGTTLYGGNLLSGTNYVIEFWAGPASAVNFSELTLLKTTTFRTNLLGVPSALPNGLTYTEALHVPGVLPGENARLGIRVWDSESGFNFDSALVKGQGALYLSAPLGGISPVDSSLYLPASWVGESFSLYIVPEPSIAALCEIGVFSLISFRRRK